MKFAIFALALLQVGPSSPQDLLNLSRPLTATEMNTVVSGIRQALAGTTLRVKRDRQDDVELLMGQAGPRMVRGTSSTASGERVATVTRDGGTTVRVPEATPERFERRIEYTGLPARRCDSSLATGEMVIEYVLDTTTQTWTATARQSHPGDTAVGRPLEMLKTSASITAAETRLIGTRTARALVSRPLFDPSERRVTGDPAPDPAEFVPVQSLWVDTTSLLPLRWEVSERQAIVGAIDFVYEPMEIRRPAGVQAPTCIP